MKGRSRVHGAATIVNAIATGLGAAFGIDLWTQAEVELKDDPKDLEVSIIGNPEEDTCLAKECFRVVLESLGVPNRFGAMIRTESNIPIACGLKSSSAAANAVVLATLSALDKTDLESVEIVRLGVTAARKAGVTVTGAFDDACASYFGGIMITNNNRLEIVKSFSFERPYPILVHVPPRKSYTKDADVKRARILSPQIRLAFHEANQGRYWEAMILNGLLYSSALGYDTSIALDALASGAISSGLSGTGPAVVAVTVEENIDKIRESWEKYEGQVLEAATNEQTARMMVQSE
jgi:shikimate kinase